MTWKEKADSYKTKEDIIAAMGRVNSQKKRHPETPKIMAYLANRLSKVPYSGLNKLEEEVPNVVVNPFGVVYVDRDSV